MGEFVGHEECPECGSKDNLARYADGGAFCFGCKYTEKPDGAKATTEAKRPADFLTGHYQAIKSRNFTEETCKRYGYQIGKLANGDNCHIAPIYNQSKELIGQHIRPPNKDKMFIIGSAKGAMLFGQRHMSAGGKRVVITTGQADALAASQAQNNEWQVVSIVKGDRDAAQEIKDNLEWLEGFQEVVLLFDMDQSGQDAVKECAPLFSPGKCKIASLPMKDASDVLLKGKPSMIQQAIWRAEPYRPDGIRSFAEVAAEAKAPITIGLPWFDDRMTRLTYGRRLGEAVVLGAGTGVGKTDIIMEQVNYDATVLNESVGLFFFEQQNFETARRLAGKYASKAFHIPDDSWKQEDLDATIDKIADLNLVYMYNHFGRTNWEVVKARMRFLAVSKGVKLFYIDNLSSLADPANERESLETLMGELCGLLQELHIWALIVSHLATPDGKPHEEGGHVALRHFKGARAISHWAFFAIGLERNKVAEDKTERLTTTLVFLKDRYTGRADGERVPFIYDTETCRLLPFNGVAPQNSNAFGGEDDFEATTDLI